MAAVNSLQKQNGLPPTGQVDKQMASIVAAAAAPMPIHNLNLTGSATLTPRNYPVRPSTAQYKVEADLVNAIYGHSKKQSGVVGASDSYSGVLGIGPVAGVEGNSEKGDGVAGYGVRGIYGESAGYQGVAGHSTLNAGVYGESQQFHAVYGFSHDRNNAGIFGTNERGWGVVGRSTHNTGISGESTNGVGVHGKGGNLAGLFEGDVSVTGNILLGNADCAEDFAIAGVEPIEPGTVMVLDDNGDLQPGSQPYDRRVAGVISGAGSFAPGIVLDKQPDSTQNRQPVALMGKVYCKVDAQYGAVLVGDLLTTSATPGHAMKAGDLLQAFGAVIGKALKPLAEGKQLIPVLITLQ